MNEQHDEREARLQQLAEEHPAMSEIDTAVDEYVRVYSVVRQAPVAEPPLDFAPQMETVTRDHAEQAGLEKWLLRIFLASGIAAFLLIGILFAGKAFERLAAQFDSLPWSLILAAVFGLALTWLVDRWREARQPLDQ